MSYELHVKVPASSPSEVASLMLRLGFESNVDSYVIDRGAVFFISAFVTPLGSPQEVSIVWAFGGAADEASTAIELADEIASAVGGSVYDPQLQSQNPPFDAVMRSWYASNTEALRNYSDGRFILRQIVDVGGKRVMLEAQQFDAPSAANFSSVAVARARLGDLIGAAGLFQRALALEATNADILFAQALTHYQLGNRDRAAEYVARALEANPMHEQSIALSAELK